MIKVIDYFKTKEGYCIEYEVVRKYNQPDGSNYDFVDRGHIFTDFKFWIYAWNYYSKPLTIGEMRKVVKENRVRLLFAPSENRFERE